MRWCDMVKDFFFPLSFFLSRFLSLLPDCLFVACCTLIELIYYMCTLFCAYIVKSMAKHKPIIRHRFHASIHQHHHTHNFPSKDLWSLLPCMSKTICTSLPFLVFTKMHTYVMYATHIVVIKSNFKIPSFLYILHLLHSILDINWLCVCYMYSMKAQCMFKFFILSLLSLLYFS